ncbi:hypothetical protein M1349_03840 [Patescibacteria group bacterium]|nr:hypothetical protein [Patescibacteria group bacterium]
MGKELSSRLAVYALKKLIPSGLGLDPSQNGHSLLGFSIKDIVHLKRPGSVGDPFNSDQAFKAADDIKRRMRSEEGAREVGVALEEHHQDVAGDIPPLLETIPGVVVFEGARPKNEEELRAELENNEELKGMVNGFHERGRHVWAEANAHKGVVLTVATVAGLVGAGIYLHHKKQNK